MFEEKIILTWLRVYKDTCTEYDDPHQAFADELDLTRDYARQLAHKINCRYSKVFGKHM